MNIVAVIKHISIKNSNYNAATDYLTTQHDEFTGKAVLDEQGNHIPRSDFILEGIHCDPYSFGEECEETNKRFNKNQTRAEIKAHHYIISFDPRDRDDNGLTTQQAQALGMKFAEKNFPGHEALVCTHPDGHNSAGNIHVHIVINSVRAYDVERQDFMERPGDALAGHKHHVTKNYLKYLKSQTMLMCQQESFYQVDLLHPAKVRITDREYWAQRRGQAKLDSKIKSSPSLSQHTTQFETEKGFLRRVITEIMTDSHSMEEFQKKMFEKYSIEVYESRGRISYLLPDRQKPIRGRSLGTDFEKEFIQHFISENHIFDQKRIYENIKKSETKSFFSQTSHHKTKQSVLLITDLETCIKAQQSRAYAQKVKISNLQKMADTLAFLQANGIETMEDLQKLRTSSKEHVKETLAKVKMTESKLHIVDKMYHARMTILKNRNVYKQYLDSPNRRDFRDEHTAEIMLYEAARKELQGLTGAKKLPSLKDIQAERSTLYRQKNAYYEDYSDARAHDRELTNIDTNIRNILNLDKTDLSIKKTLS